MHLNGLFLSTSNWHSHSQHATRPLPAGTIVADLTSGFGVPEPNGLALAIGTALAVACGRGHR